MKGTTTMWKNVAIAGSVGAVILGSGAVALAATGGSSPASGADASTAPAAVDLPAANGRLGALAGRALHGTWVTRDGSNSGEYVQHDAIRGVVTSVSATSITVKAADNVTMTFVVDTSTKVKTKAGTSISDVHTDDAVAVVGTGSSTMTAAHVVGQGVLAGRGAASPNRPRARA
jgi:hypothetical protein